MLIVFGYRTQQFVALIKECNSQPLLALGGSFPGLRDSCDKLMPPSKLTIPTKPTAYCNPKIQQYQQATTHKTYNSVHNQYHPLSSAQYHNNDRNPSTFSVSPNSGVCGLDNQMEDFYLCPHFCMNDLSLCVIKLDVMANVKF